MAACPKVFLSWYKKNYVEKRIIVKKRVDSKYIQEEQVKLPHYNNVLATIVMGIYLTLMTVWYINSLNPL